MFAGPSLQQSTRNLTTLQVRLLFDAQVATFAVKVAALRTSPHWPLWTELAAQMVELGRAWVAMYEDALGTLETESRSC